MKKFCFSLLGILLISFSSCASSGTSSKNSSLEPSSSKTSTSLQSSLESSPISSKESKDSKISSIEESSRSISSVIPTEDPFYTDFYNPSSNVELIFNIKNKAIYNLAKYGDSKSNKKSDMYHPADLIVIINGETYEFPEVGMRMKGNTSRDGNFVNSNGYFNKSGYWGGHVNYKISFNETFDDSKDCDYYTHKWESDESRQERKDRRFGQAKKFDIKWNKNYDGTFTKEAYAAYMFRNEGMDAQQENLVKVTINTENDTFTDTYLAYECIDKDFIKRRYEKAEQKGNLYKVSYTHGLCDFMNISTDTVGVEDVPNSKFYDYDLKTNDDTPDHSLLYNVSNILKSTEAIDTYKPTLESVVDIDQFLKYAALSYVAFNPDDFRYNGNNCYFYFPGSSATEGKLRIIPYDNDRVFGVWKDWHPENFDASRYANSSRNVMYNRITNPLYWRTLIKGQSDYEPCKEWQDKYLEYCLEFGEKYLDSAVFKAFTEKFYYAKSTDINNKGDSANETFAAFASTHLQAIKNTIRDKDK